VFGGNPLLSVRRGENMFAATNPVKLT